MSLLKDSSLVVGILDVLSEVSEKVRAEGVKNIPKTEQGLKFLAGTILFLERMPSNFLDCLLAVKDKTHDEVLKMLDEEKELHGKMFDGIKASLKDSKDSN